MDEREEETVEDEEQKEDIEDEDAKEEDKMSVEDDDKTDVEEEVESNESSMAATPVSSELEARTRSTVTLTTGSHSPSHSPEVIEKKPEHDGTQSLASDDNVSHRSTLPCSAGDPHSSVSGDNTHVLDTDDAAHTSLSDTRSLPLTSSAQGDAHTPTAGNSLVSDDDIAIQEAASLLASLSDSLLTPPRPHLPPPSLPPPSLPPSSFSEVHVCGAVQCIASILLLSGCWSDSKENPLQVPHDQH